MVPKWSPARLPIPGQVKQNCHEANKVEKNMCLIFFMFFILNFVKMVPKLSQAVTKMIPRPSPHPQPGQTKPKTSTFWVIFMYINKT